MNAAEALARANHPERPSQTGDWGPRVWRVMLPSMRRTAIEKAQETIGHLNALGFDVTPLARKEQP